MRTIRLKISDKVFDKFLSFLSRFTKEEIEIINAGDNTQAKDFWNEISEAEKKSIDLGISDANSGNLKSNMEAKKIYGKWL